MEANQAEPVQKPAEEIMVVIPSKKLKIESIQQQEAKAILECKDQYANITTIKIEGNSYSLQFCEKFGEILSEAKSLTNLNINDIFVSRLSTQIPKSIEYIATGLRGSNLVRLDISNNAVNPYGAASLLIYLKQAASLEVLLIYNCGLGSGGAAKIAEGFAGTPKLKTLSIGRNRIEGDGAKSIAENLKHIPLLEELMIYQNGIKNDLIHLFKSLRQNCKNLSVLDIQDNFLTSIETTKQLAGIIKDNLLLKIINLTDTNATNQMSTLLVEAFKTSVNRNWEKIGLNYAELDEDSILELVAVLKECPLKRIDLVGNEFSKKLQKKIVSSFEEGVVSSFEDDDEEEVLRLLEEMKI